MHGIPPAKDTDAEDVVWALQTADALWKRGERRDAVVWLRRAAQAAGDVSNDDRALELARCAAELSDAEAAISVDMSLGDPPEGRAPNREPGVVSAPPSAEPISAEPVSIEPLSIDSGPVITPAPVAVPPPPLPPRLDISVGALEVSSVEIEAPAPSDPPRSTVSSVPPAEMVHAGMLNPWEDVASVRVAPLPPRRPREAVELEPEVESDEVITSAPRSSVPRQRLSSVASVPPAARGPSASRPDLLGDVSGPALRAGAADDPAGQAVRKPPPLPPRPPAVARASQPDIVACAPSDSMKAGHAARRGSIPELSEPPPPSGRPSQPDGGLARSVPPPLPSRRPSMPDVETGSAFAARPPMPSVAGTVGDPPVHRSAPPPLPVRRATMPEMEAAPPSVRPAQASEPSVNRSVPPPLPARRATMPDTSDILNAPAPARAPSRPGAEPAAVRPTPPRPPRRPSVVDVPEPLEPPAALASTPAVPDVVAKAEGRGSQPDHPQPASRIVESSLDPRATIADVSAGADAGALHVEVDELAQLTEMAEAELGDVADVADLTAAPETAEGAEIGNLGIAIDVAIDPAVLPTTGLDLSSAEAFADLPDDARRDFAAAATLHELSDSEEASGFALAYVVAGAFDVAATMVDAPVARLGPGAVLRARGTTQEAVPVRLISADHGGLLATWALADVEAAFRTCPWVDEDLRRAADHVQTLVGITIGPLGERIDAAIRDQIVGRLEVRSLLEGEVIVEASQPVPGLVLVGIGELELVRDGAVVGTIGSGEFLFPGEVLGAGAAPATARAGAGGALVLLGSRQVAEELMMTCPPLVEVLAGM